MKSVFGWVAALAIIVPAGMAAAGDMQVVPYGFILVNGGYNSHVATDIPVSVSMPTTLRDSSGSFLLTARQTRFGLKMTMDSVQGWTVKGQLEFDFWGQKGSGKNGASMQSAPRLRLAFFTLKKNRIQLLFGQDWTCFAPLNPNSLAHVSIPPLSSSGNLWNRLPQVRLDYTVPMANDNSVLIQVAAVRPIAADTSDDTQSEALGAGEFGGLPFGQARVAFNHAKTFTVGFSAHFGQQDWQKAYGWAYTDDKTKTFGIAGDAKVTSDDVSVSVEAYTGSNLTMLFSNAASYDKAGSAGNTREPVDVTGGWGEMILKPKESKVSFSAAAGIEVVDEEPVSYQATSTKPVLQKNWTVFGTIMYDPLPKVTLAFEVGYIRTTNWRKDLAEDLNVIDDASNLNVNAAFRLSF